MAEYRSFRNISHEELNNYEKLHGCLVESNSYGACWCFTGSTGEMFLRIGIGKLDSSNSTKIIHVSSYLIVWCIWWEFCLSNEGICLGNIGSGDVVAEKKDNDGGLGILILS